MVTHSTPTARCFVRVVLVLTVLCVHSIASAQQMPWTLLDEMPASVVSSDPWVRPLAYQPLALDLQEMRDALAQAPRENFAAPQPGLMILLPMPDGSLEPFHVWESPVMEPGLAAQFPDVHTYVGCGVDSASTLRCDVTMQGFHAQVLSPDGAVYIDPFSRANTTHYSSYFKRDSAAGDHEWECFAHGEGFEVEPLAPAPEQVVVTLRTYRAAIAATGEYTQFFGGTVAGAQNAIVTVVNRVNGVLERDVAARIQLVANNTSVVYTNPSTDPYSSNSPNTLLNENPSVLNAVIGFNNYDIGHVFGIAGGGVAYLQSVCTGNKAGASSTSGFPVGDGFAINVVAHEMGHQFGAAHIFNGNGTNCGTNRSAGSAYEPGSGSTIMSYAGVCNSANNLQSNSDAYYNHHSLDQIRSLIYGPANACSQQTITTNETPVVSPLPNRSIPTLTPFELATPATDVNGDTLTYCWEQRNLGPSQPATGAGSQDNGLSPIFRSFFPTVNASRPFPKLTSLLANTTVIGEQLPALPRALVARLTVRDNHVGAGGLGLAQTVVTVVDTGSPFLVLSPNTAGTLSGTINVTWLVASTNISPISTPTVDIYLSTNGGSAFGTLLAEDVPNDGSHAVTLPNITSSAARIKVKGHGNYFFDVSNANFSIVPAPCYPDCDSNGVLNIFDYVCFGIVYNAGDPYADCDNNGSFNVFDYICYSAAYATGCP